MPPVTGAGSSKSIWTEEAIRATLASDLYNYQQIDLPFGLKTKGHDRSATAQAIFTGDWTNQSVLDIGSSLGYFLFEAKRHGAGRCVGMDLSTDNVRCSSTLADILGLDVEFRYGDLDEGPVGETFDNVLCLNVIHHLVDPILGINRLIEATGNRLVLEVATIGSHDRRKLGIGFLPSLALEKLPAVIVGRGTAGEGVKQFYLTIPAIENLMRFRRGCFASVTVKPSGFKNRFLVVGEKRKIGHLLVVAGPPGLDLDAEAKDISAGKAALGGVLPGADTKGWPVLRAADYHLPQPSKIEKQILAYDFMRPLISGATSYSHDPVVDVFGCGRKVQFVTLWKKPEDILAKLQKDAADSSSSSKKTYKRAREHMRNPRDLIGRYDNWFAYTKGKGEHVILDVSTSQPAVMSVENWRNALLTEGA